MNDRGIATWVVTAVAGALEELGVTVPASQHATFVPGSQADAILDAAARKLGDDALALSLARRLPIGSLGLIDYGLCSSQTLREGVRRVARHYGVVSGRVRLAFVEQTQTSRVILTREPGTAYSRHWIEFSFAILAERARQAVGAEARFERVRFAHAAPRRTDVYDALFGVRVEFGANEDMCELSARVLDLPLRTALPALGETLEARIRELGPATEAEVPLLDKLREIILRDLADGGASVGELAAELGLNRRALQRQLQRHGTSPQKLLDVVRRDRALVLLATPGLSVGDVSEQLGFSEPSAFFRAFRRWTGRSPRELSQKVTGAVTRRH